jgi:hypothetical protein
MPFRLTNAPATFMRLTNDVFQPSLDKCVMVFLDDILIYSKSEQQHHEHSQMVFNILRANKLYVNRSKCEFGKSEVEFLGHMISTDGLRPMVNKVEAVKSLKTPANVSELRGFLGLSSYYRRFIRRYAKIATPLNQMTKKEVAF